jgi:NAD(P)-dependent dehydrogenase (short-subunit alcohol dehydrogenase family)
MLLNDKVCLIVGAASERGIGFATARLFREHGASVVALDIEMEGSIVATLNRAAGHDRGPAGRIEGRRCDVTNRADCAEAIRWTCERFGRIDGLVNCAGIVTAGSMLSISAAELDRMIDINLKGAFNVCQSVVEVMSRQGSGSIVNVASVAAQRGGGLVGGAHYAASKGGVISLTRSIAREFGPTGLRANTVCPSLIETAMLDGNINEQQMSSLLGQIPLGRAGHPIDVAGACLFLISELSAYVTGATIDVNGGSHIH